MVSSVVLVVDVVCPTALERALSVGAPPETKHTNLALPQPRTRQREPGCDGPPRPSCRLVQVDADTNRTRRQKQFTQILTSRGEFL